MAYYYLNGHRIGLSVNGTISYLASDLLGSAEVALNSSGSATASVLYGPYGTARYTNGAMPTDYTFTGQRGDTTTGLDDYGARYYDPVVGQFTSADSDARGGLNRYAYVHDDPETFTDPTGRVLDCGTTDCGAGPPLPPCKTNCGGNNTPPQQQQQQQQPNNPKLPPAAQHVHAHAFDAIYALADSRGELGRWDWVRALKDIAVFFGALMVLSGTVAALIVYAMNPEVSGPAALITGILGGNALAVWTNGVAVALAALAVMWHQLSDFWGMVGMPAGVADVLTKVGIVLDDIAGAAAAVAAATTIWQLPSMAVKLTSILYVQVPTIGALLNNAQVDGNAAAQATECSFNPGQTCYLSD